MNLPKGRPMINIARTLTLLVVSLSCLNQLSAKEPLKVYILVGQSNMQGHAQISTFDHVGMDPKTAPILKLMRDKEGTPRICERVWISSIGNGGSDAEYHGKLTAGYGAKGRDAKIGPEFTFGIYTQELETGPILIIKTAWGGKSLHTDFRPPSAGPYVFNETQLANLKKQGKDIDKARKERQAASGHYYRLMLEHVKTVLADVKRIYPDYAPNAGYELKGFAWFQGWNDMVDRGVYPNRDNPGGYGLYSKLMAQFIRDVRKDLSAPKLPFVIGVLGVGGPVEKYDDSQRRYTAVHSGFRNAMAAPASLPEFKGNVIAVRTENYWDGELNALKNRAGTIRGKSKTINQDKNLTTKQKREALAKLRDELYTDREREILKGSSNAAYHYLGSAKIMAQIGKGFAEAIAKMNNSN